MPACTFFGHRECPEDIRDSLTRIIIDLIVNQQVDMFYVGNQGRFDQIALGTLRIVKSLGLDFEYAVVHAYFPDKQPFYVRYDAGETVYPEGLEQVHPKFAISWRNDWMLKQSDYVVAYIKHFWGGAAKYVQKAKRQ